MDVGFFQRNGHDYYLFMVVLICSHLVHIHNKTKYKILIVFIFLVTINAYIFFFFFIQVRFGQLNRNAFCVCVSAFFFFFFFFFLQRMNNNPHCSCMQITLCMRHCLLCRRHYLLFTGPTITLFRKKILKMGLMVLFTYLKIILLQCFQFSAFSCIQTNP